MKNNKIIILVAGIVLALAIVKLYRNKNIVEENVYRPTPGKAVTVKVLKVTEAPLERTYSYTGKFEPLREVSISPQVQGTVRSVHFGEGDLVKKGDVLVQLDDDLLQAQLIGVKAAFETAKKNLERYQQAVESQGVSPLQLDKASLEHKTAESQFRQLEKNIALHRVTAPFSGIVTLKNVEPGSLVGMQPIAVLSDLSGLKFEMFVPEGEVSLFKEGDVVSVESDLYPSKKFAGVVDFVDAAANQNHQYRVKILLQKDGLQNLRAGMFGKIVVVRNEKNPSILIPRTALLGSSKNPQVFVLDDSVAVLTQVTTRAGNEDQVEVTSGLKIGDQVVYSGQINLTNGSKAVSAN